MRDLPANQLNPKIKNVWRINDAIWLTVVFLCCFVPFAIAAAVAAVVLLTQRPDTDPGPAGGTEFPGPAGSVTATVPTPTDLVGTRAADGSAVFTWTNPDEQEGDTYLWGRRTVTGEPQLEIVEDTTVTVPADGTGEVCIEVSVVRADRRASTVPAEGCVP